MKTTLTINGVAVTLSGSAADIAEFTTLVVDKEAPAARSVAKEAPKEVYPKHRKAGTKTVPVERKTDGVGTGQALTKDSRRAFAKAFLTAFGEPDPVLVEELGAKGTMLHWSTKQLATYALATSQIPKGYRIGAGYYRLLGAEAQRVVAEAKKHLAPQGRQRDAKGRFVS